jgi:hypothetical protein
MCHGVTLLCHVLRSDQLQVLDFLHRERVTSVRAGWRQVIDVSGDCSGVHLQAA